MANLSQIKTDSDWGLEASKINQNFNQVNTELTTLKNTTSVRQPLFSSTTEASKNITSPYVGQLVLIGSTIPAPIYRWNGSSWANTGQTGGSAEVPLTNYYTKDEINQQKEDTYLKFSELDKKFNELNISALYPTQGIGGTNKYDLAGAIAQVPIEYRTIVGLKIIFINNTTSETETWKYDGGTFTSTASWKQGDVSGGNTILEWVGDVASTRKQVPLLDRRKLLQISYTNDNGETVNEQFIGTGTYDASWVLDANWQRIVDGKNFNKNIYDNNALISVINTTEIVDIGDEIEFLTDASSSVASGGDFYFNNVFNDSKDILHVKKIAINVAKAGKVIVQSFILNLNSTERNAIAISEAEEISVTESSGKIEIYPQKNHYVGNNIVIALKSEDRILKYGDGANLMCNILNGAYNNLANKSLDYDVYAYKFSGDYISIIDAVKKISDNFNSINESIYNNTSSINDIKQSISLPSVNELTSNLDKDIDFEKITTEANGMATGSFYSNFPLQNNGYLDKITIKRLSTNNVTKVQVKVGEVNPDTLDVTIIKDYGEINISSDDINIKDKETFYNKGVYVFIRFLDGKFYFSTALRADGYEIKNATPDKAIKQTLTVAAEVYLYGVNYEPYSATDIKKDIEITKGNIENNKTEIENLKKQLDSAKRTSEYISIFKDDFSTKKSDWINTENWTFNTQEKYIAPTVLGGINTNLIKLNRVYHGDLRILRFNAIFGSDTVMNIAMQRSDNNTGEGESLYQIDIPNKKLIMYKRGNGYKGIDLNTKIVESQISFNLNVDDIYLVEVEKNDYTYYLRLINTRTSDYCEAMIEGWEAGRQNRNYGFSLQSGTPFKIFNLDILMLNNPTIVFAGNSISEGVGLYSTDISNPNNLTVRYAEVIRKEIGNCLISAEGGDTILDILAKFESEYNIIKPKYMSVCIGTNHGISVNTEEKFKELIDKCKAINCIPIIHRIPCCDIPDNRYKDINDMIVSLSKSEDYGSKFVLGCRFDTATAKDYYEEVTVEHPSTTDNNTRVDLSLFTDGVHPNYIGASRMVKRFAIDIPFVFNL